MIYPFISVFAIMAYYYKVNQSEDPLHLYKGFHHQKVKKFKGSGPKINYDFSKHVLIELLDDFTPESKLWSALGLTNNKNVVYKRIMIDSHRIKCRRAVVICINSAAAKQVVQDISQTKIINRCVCAVVIQDLLSDLCLFEKQIIQFGDGRPQYQLLYVSDLNRCREPSGLVRFLKEKFSPFGTILSVLVCSDDDGYAYPEGVIKFAYLSEAFAAELAYDQYVVGKERLSVTAHHNILLSECDLRLRLRDAQQRNNAEINIYSDSFINSCKLNDLSSFEEDQVVNSINNLQISSETNNVIHNENTLMHDNLSVAYPEDSQQLMHIQCDGSVSDYLRKNCDNLVTSGKGCVSSLSQSESNKDIICSMNSTETSVIENVLKPNRHLNKDNQLNHFSVTIPNNITIAKRINLSKESPNDQIDSECKLNPESFEGCSVRKGSKTKSVYNSFVSCNNGPDPRIYSSLLSPEKTVYNSFHCDELSVVSEYYSISSDCKQLSSVQNVSKKVNGKCAASNSRKRRKYFTPSQKLCLKSQRTGLSQNTVQNSNTKSEISDSSSSQASKPPKSDKLSRKNIDPCHFTSKCLSSLPEDPGSAKVTNWLSHLSSSQSTIFTYNIRSELNMEIPTKKHNRISIYNTPFLKNLKKNDHKSCSDNSSVENEDPNENLVISDKNLSISQIDKFRSPLQIWLKQELMSSTNNSIIKSQETSKSVIVCAAKTKDVIISIGCSHMTCEFCYTESTELLLGYN